MVLIDNTVLSNFALAGELILLKEYCRGRGATTREVLDEFKRGIKGGIFANIKLEWFKGLDLKDAKEKILYVNLNRKLGAGEASCLAIAIHRKYGLLSDDMAVRKIAMREGIRLSGSIGVLIELIRIKRISLERGNKILGNFIKYGYFSPVDKLDEFL